MTGVQTCALPILKLESYMEGDSFASTQFYTDIEGHPEDRMVKLAFEELAFFTASMKILGVYPAHAFRDRHRK